MIDYKSYYIEFTLYSSPPVIANSNLKIFMFYRDLTVAAQNASFVDAELLINSMGREGLEVSANALHSLIFAYAKAGRSLSAYKTLRAMRQAGKLPQKYPLSSTCNIIFT